MSTPRHRPRHPPSCLVPLPMCAPPHASPPLPTIPTDSHYIDPLYPSPLQNQSPKKKNPTKMLESASVPLLSWLLSLFTPTVLFLLLNLIVLTIVLSAFTASAAGPHNNNNNRLSRSPSIVFDRLKSFNLYSYRPTEPITETQHPEPEPEPEPEVHIARSQSDTKPAGGEVPKKLSKKMKKSATLKSAFNHFEFGDDEKRKDSRPATTRERVAKEEDAEVDARADDFINRFRHQLKLQRLDSFVRYKEMLKRGH